MIPTAKAYLCIPLYLIPFSTTICGMCIMALAQDLMAGTVAELLFVLFFTWNAKMDENKA